jgi:MYXO-CTERM domain-containing protein
MLLTTTARAGSFRGAAVSWRVPDSIGAPNTVEVSITTIWDQPTTDTTTADLDFGDGASSTGLSGTATYTGTTNLGQGFTVQQTTVTHAYAAAGKYTLVLSGCCRHATTNNIDGTLPFKLTATVALGTGMFHSPAWLALEPTLDEFEIPTAFGDAQSPTAREATQAESGLAIPELPDLSGVMHAPSPTASPEFATVTVLWVGNSPVGSTYELAFLVIDARGGSSAIDLIAEVTASGGFGGRPDAYEVGGAPGQMISNTGSNQGTSVALANLPASAMVTAGSAQWNFSWTPAPTDLDTYHVALVELVMSDGSHEETGFAVYVEPQIDECTNGTADCDPIAAACRDTVWGYTCTCNPRFRGDGKTCTAFCDGGDQSHFCLGPLGKEPAYCCGNPADGTFTCTCPSGSGSNPVTPEQGCGGCGTTDGTGAIMVILGVTLLRSVRRRRQRVTVD